MFEKIIVALIVLLCAFFIGRRLFRQLGGAKNTSGCGCSCSGCDSPNKQSDCCGTDDLPKE